MTPKGGQHTWMEVPLPEPPPSLSIPTDRVVIVDGSYANGLYGCALVVQTRGSSDWVWGSTAGTCFNALAAELEAISYAMIWAVDQHVNEVSIVSDSKILVQALNQKKCPDWHLFATFSFVLSLLSSFTVCNFLYVKRCFISNVDKLANESRHSHGRLLISKGRISPESHHPLELIYPELRQEYDAYFYKVFKVYTQVWKFQQENRHKLVETGLKRSEIGDIASRIAQLYFAHYMRTSQASYLHEAFIFYDAILTRDYFNFHSHSNASPHDISLASKHLRFISRFLMVCLLLNRREMVQQLLNQLRLLLDECKRTFKETDFKEWKLVLQELVRFLKYDTNFMNIRPLRYSVVLDTFSDSLSPHNCSRNLRLRDAVLASYHHNEVKFSEVTLDTFRMLQCLEWEPCGSFYQSNLTKNGQNGPSAAPKDILDPTLPPNPRKAVLYRPSITHFLAVVATICEELPPDGILLIYLSASGARYTDTTSPSPLGSVLERLDPSSEQPEECSSALNSGCLHFGTRGNGGINCIYPSDLVPFTRRPLFLVIDGDSNEAFEAINGAAKGEMAAILLSPRSSYHCTSTGSPLHSTGSLFTVFLTAPLQAFCLLLCISDSDVEMDTFVKAEKLISSFLKDWGVKLAASDSLHPVWAQILNDPFLRRLVLRFLFCQAVLALHAPTFNKDEFVPKSLPALPPSFLPSTVLCQTLVMQLANIFGATNSFIFSDSVALPENAYGDTDSMSSS
uniref:RNase H type-1 domain-containing protein n=1 Tax=Cannabis sativa TaxID=3483 RepID=A0A803Q4A2_CANSA